MDPTRFSGKDVIEMAVRIEENGLTFYTEAAIASESEEIKELFQFLGDEEKRHIYCFENIGKSFDDDNLPGISDPYMEEASIYLGALANSRVFTEPDEGSRMAKEVRDENDAFKDCHRHGEGLHPLLLRAGEGCEGERQVGSLPSYL